jgi:transcriptional regulator with XRE-family HTH domain
MLALLAVLSMGLLGERLKELRGTRALYDVEKATGITRIEVSRYEKGSYYPSPKNLSKLAEFFGVTYDELRILYYDDFFSDPKERELVLQWAARELGR